MAFRLGKLTFQQRSNFLPFSHWDIALVKEKVGLGLVCGEVEGSQLATCVQKKKSVDADFCHNTAYNSCPSPKSLADCKTLISILLYQFKSECKIHYGFSVLTSTGVKQNNLCKSDFSFKKQYCLGYNQLMIMSVKRNYCSQVGNISQQKEIKKDKSDKQAGQSQENLAKIQERLKLLVMDMFKNQHDYGVLHKDVVMENNLFGANKKRIGVMAYAVELMKLRLRIHVRYPGAYCDVEDVKLLELEGSHNVIRIQWKLRGVPQKHIIKFWRLREPFVHSDIEYLNGFSYFHIGSDGLIHKHRLEKVSLQRKNEEKIVKKKDHSVPFLG
ncbi:unnamed protein product [Lymnaea stagnalis]|uniref:Uncharacterized protein n=1 Tax=Lymnaea stagnalis TaxID=6523 RepID=A0AAV2HLD4_LYMST